MEIRKYSTRQARQIYRPGKPDKNSDPKSQLETDLREHGVAQVRLTVSPSEFDELNSQYAICIAENRRWLDFTSWNFNKDGDPEDGHVRKEAGHNDRGMQTRDPKSIFHFNNSLREWWESEGRRMAVLGSHAFHQFMNSGFEIHNELTNRDAYEFAGEIDASFEGFRELTFYQKLSNATLRCLRYDGYPTHDRSGRLIVEQNSVVAKEHYDRGIMTIQANASAPGFWMQPERAKGPMHPRIHMPWENGQSQLFMGGGYREVYGTKGNPIHPLFHGVDRIFDESQTHIPPRTANILFVDSPVAHLDVNGLITQPFRSDKENLDV